MNAATNFKLHLLPLLLLSLSTAISNAAEQQQPVSTASVGKNHRAPVQWISGSISPKEWADLSAERAGTVTFIAEFGQQAEQGELLVQIDDALLQVQLQRLQVALEDAREQRKYDEKQLARLKSLTKRNNVSETQLDEAEHAVRLSRLKERTAQLEVRQHQIELSHTRIMAPFPGIVAECYLQANEMVSRGEPLLKLVNQSKLEVIIATPLHLLPFINGGDNLRVKIKDGSTAMARVERRAPLADDRSRLVELRLSFTEPTPWMIGSPVEVALPTGPGQPVLTVPRDAVAINTKGKAVFLLKDDKKVVRIPVEVLFSIEDDVAVKGALKPGDRIVVRGSGQLKDGDTVKVVDAT